MVPLYKFESRNSDVRLFKETRIFLTYIFSRFNFCFNFPSYVFLVENADNQGVVLDMCEKKMSPLFFRLICWVYICQGSLVYA